jgi:hypothetical protein
VSDNEASWRSNLHPHLCAVGPRSTVCESFSKSNGELELPTELSTEHQVRGFVASVSPLSVSQRARSGESGSFAQRMSLSGRQSSEMQKQYPRNTPPPPAATIRTHARTHARIEKRAHARALPPALPNTLLLSRAHAHIRPPACIQMARLLPIRRASLSLHTWSLLLHSVIIPVGFELQRSDPRTFPDKPSSRLLWVKLSIRPTAFCQLLARVDSDAAEAQRETYSLQPKALMRTHRTLLHARALAHARVHAYARTCTHKHLGTHARNQTEDKLA